MTITAERNKKAKAKPKAAPQAEKKAKPKSNSQAEKRALIDSLCGSLSWVDYSVDEYLREKREEVKRENGK